jgi:D-alanyl-D-alanine carboxypeptidase/D-alanyl-D-alanine-endopeptidase (penicillin-binding protein 4)
MKGRMKKLLIAVVFTFWLVSAASADLAKRIDSIVGRKSQKKVQFSIHIIEADSGKTVYSRNARKALIPASNMKIITTAAALKYLGPNYEYKTKVGLCNDTLVIIGGGDPLLGDKVTDMKYGRRPDWIFEDITSALKQKRVKTIKDIIVDSSIFDDERVHPNWRKDELNRPYACQVSGLNYNGNCVEVAAKTVKSKVKLAIVPATSYVKLINKCKPTSKRRNTAWCARPPGKNTITVLGRCYKECKVRVTVERPAIFFGFVLAENLAKAGIEPKGKVSERAAGEDCSVRLLGTYRTPIADCLARCNKDSFGLAAEALAKTISAYSNKGFKNGSWVKGLELISEYLLRLGIGKEEFHIDDGSGLSRQNKLSANAITKVLLRVYKSKDWKLYKGSLAVGGVDGTIKKYFKEKKYKGKILGKTGYIAGVKSFSGVCSTTEGDYIFSIIANKANGRTRTVINDIAKAIFN